MTLPTSVVPGSLELPSTASTTQIYATIRQVLLEYVSPDNSRLSNLIHDRLWVRSPYANAVFPYVTIRLDRTSLAAYNGYRETAVLEVQAVGKPESQLPLVESIMDIIDQCLTAYTDARSGLMVGRSRTRQTVPMLTDPADESVVAVIATYDLFLWPRVLTSRAD